ncbi:MAG: dockerin type I repeat-containing protein, partial [Oscillospiraceae bacterium]|nr:dockerin type I repeat-containing protein [Oscillospiraceae bacterium]
LGVWGSGKCNIQLSKETEGEGYRAVVYWTNTAATATEWICKNCTFNVEEAGVSFICNGGVSRMELTFAEDGTEISAETYTKGSSSFIIINDTLTWNDNEEDLGAGMLFEKAQVTYQAGDADGSGEVDILDVITVNKSILGKELMTEAQIKAVDFNGNGKPDSSESLTILKYIVGLITDFHA